MMQQALALLRAAVFGALVAAMPVWAAEFPSTHLSLVVPFSAGGPTDAMARELAHGLKDQLGQPVIVDNRAGAGGNIGAAYVARAAPDGYTILFGTSGPLAINASLYKKPGFDPLQDFAPVIMIGHLPNVLLVHPSVPAKDVQELIKYAKANPDKLTFASSGSGASSHLAGVLFNQQAGTDITHVPYKGTGPALTDLVGGHVSMSFTDILTALPYVQSGKVRALGVTTATRSPVLPNVPTVAEQGLQGFDVSVFFGIVVPKKTPPQVVEKLNRAFAETLAQPKVKDALAKQGIVPAPSTAPEYLTQFMQKEIPKWRTLVKTSGAQLD